MKAKLVFKKDISLLLEPHFIFLLHPRRLAVTDDATAKHKVKYPTFTVRSSEERRRIRRRKSVVGMGLPSFVIVPKKEGRKEGRKEA